MSPLKLLLALLPALVSAHAHFVTPVTFHREQRARSPGCLALAIPGDSTAAAFLVEGSLNFLSVYGGIITLRILLSWVPQAQSVALLRPVFTVSDVYLNLFRGVIPPVGGLDLSPIAAFFVLNLLTNSVASLGAPAEPGTACHRTWPRVGIADRVRKEWAKRLIA